jgi:hypothetical protein
MSKSKTAFVATFAGLCIAAPAFAQSQEDPGSVLPYYYEGGREVWGSWYARDPENIGQRVPQSAPRRARRRATRVGPQ